MDPEHAFSEELFILARQYSPWRRSSGHWETQILEKAQGSSITAHDNTTITFGKTIDNQNFVSVLNVNGTTSTYLCEDFLLRMAIKRQKQTFNLIKKFWAELKLSRSNILPKDLYIKICSLVANEFKAVVQTRDIQFDMQLDYADKSGLSFWDFYDSYFELVDNFAQSKQFSSIIAALRKIQEAIKKYKIRYDAPRWYNLQEAFHPWMYPHLGVPNPANNKLCNEWKVQEVKAQSQKNRPRTVSIRQITIGSHPIMKQPASSDKIVLTNHSAQFAPKNMLVSSSNFLADYLSAKMRKRTSFTTTKSSNFM